MLMDMQLAGFNVVIFCENVTVGVRQFNISRWNDQSANRLRLDGKMLCIPH